MRTWFFFTAILFALSLAGLAIQPATAATTKTLLPFSYTTSVGGSGGQAVTVLHHLDQSGTADDPTRYLTLTTPGAYYLGSRSYQLPPTILRSWITGIKVFTNFKGAAAATQLWSWYLYDWTLKQWVQVGTNGAAIAGQWTLLGLPTSQPQRFVSDAGRLVVLFRSNNTAGDAKLDYEALIITYTPNSPTIGGCPMLPNDNIWNTRIDKLSVHPRSSQYITSIGRSRGLHMDFGSGTWDGGPIGIPYNLVPSTQPRVPISFDYYDESDLGPYPIPSPVKMEYGSDHHILLVDTGRCLLYETWDSRSNGNGAWSAGSGAIFRLNANALRPATWTSADAAGLPILPGLVRYEEIAGGAIRHALRFTANRTQRSYVWPARHYASSITDLSVPPMGMRFRLKASFNIAPYPAQMQVLLRAMKEYGLILADNGSDWYVSGAPDARWDNDVLHLLDVIVGDNFEAVDTSSLMIDPNSGQAKQIP